LDFSYSRTYAALKCRSKRLVAVLSLEERDVMVKEAVCRESKQRWRCALLCAQVCLHLQSAADAH